MSEDLPPCPVCGRPARWQVIAASIHYECDTELCPVLTYTSDLTASAD